MSEASPNTGCGCSSVVGLIIIASLFFGYIGISLRFGDRTINFGSGVKNETSLIDPADIYKRLDVAKKLIESLPEEPSSEECQKIYETDFHQVFKDMITADDFKRKCDSGYLPNIHSSTFGGWWWQFPDQNGETPIFLRYFDEKNHVQQDFTVLVNGDTARVAGLFNTIDGSSFRDPKIEIIE
ncbi:hypothetical protein [Thiolinea disciformis]|uniref:hypothetical protein n=1 Tax=Thiolinea disciformis TaxID=125614 RepID=UPI00037B438B|nr:hypothetical protein [Thiolinea disciformis]